MISLAPDQNLLPDRIGEIDAYYASWQIRITEEILAKVPQPRVIATATTGLDHVDLEALARRNVAVHRTKDGF